MATSVSKRTRGITWTLFNYEACVDNIKQYAKDECEYMIFGFEVCPTTNKKHLQGYLYYTNARTYPNKKWRETAPGVRDFISRGDPQSNYDYCSKLGDFWQYGELPKQGARTDWEQARSHLQAGTDITTVIEAQPQLLPCIRSLERFQQLSLRPLNRDVKVITLIGGAGTGKTRWAYDQYPNLYSKPDGPWFDGYSGQTTLLLDDYYGDIPYSQFLKILDRYPLHLPVKGGFIYAQYNTVIVTSNRHPDDWYPNGYTTALQRRINILCIDSIPDAPSQELQEEASSQEVSVPTAQDHEERRP